MKRSLTVNPISWEITDGGRDSAFPFTSKADRRIGDCVIRAITIATQQDYKKVWTEMFDIAKNIGLFPNNDGVCIEYLKEKGWKEIKFSGKEVVRINDTRVTDHAKGKFIIVYVRHHWVAMKDNVVYDTWNSSMNSESNYSRVFRIYIHD